MLRTLANLLYRRKDPTRQWRRDDSKLAVDVRRCTLMGAALGDDYRGLEPLGPSQDAKKAVGGFLAWHSRNICCMVENQRIDWFMVILAPAAYGHAYPGTFVRYGMPVNISVKTTADELRAAIGEPFGCSNNDWDDADVLFYEYDQGEVQYAFDKALKTLMSIEFWYEPELSGADQCEAYGIGKELPECYRRALQEDAPGQ